MVHQSASKTLLEMMKTSPTAELYRATKHEVERLSGCIVEAEVDVGFA